MGLRDRFFKPPGKDRFARMLMDAIRQAGQQGSLRYDADEFRLYQEGEGKCVLNLTSAYREYCSLPKDKRQVLFKNLVRAWFSHRREVPQEFGDARPDLLPGVRGRAYYEIARLTVGAEHGAKFGWPYHVLAECLGAGLIYDLPEAMMQVQQHSLDTWKASFEEAFEAACENLREISGDGLGQAGPGVWMSPWRDNYDTSRMVLLDVVRAHEVSGDPVVMIPNRDTLLLAGSEDAEALGKLVALAEAAYEHPRSISGAAFRLGPDNQWSRFMPGEGDPHHQRFKLLWTKSVGGDYQNQTEALNALHEKTGKDIFVASFSAMQKKDTGEVRSYSVWSEGVVAFLPRTDDVFFFRPKGPQDGEIIGSARWERVEAVLGDMIKPVGLYPERYLVEEFPSEGQLAMLALEQTLR
jgi:hypothetical protein